MPSTLPPSQVYEEEAGLEKGVGIFKVMGENMKGELRGTTELLFLPEAGKGVLPPSSIPQESGGA